MVRVKIIGAIEKGAEDIECLVRSIDRAWKTNARIKSHNTAWKFGSTWKERMFKNSRVTEKREIKEE